MTLQSTEAPMSGRRMVTVTRLLTNFAEACRALTPMLDLAHVPWTDLDRYDNWDRIGEALFLSLVAEPCVYQAEAAGLSARFRPLGFASGESNAYLAINGTFRFIDLSSQARPFDTVRHEEGSLPLRDADVTCVIEAGGRYKFREVDLSL
jgi:hypothetical protein